ncbi:MAG: glucose-1-phosphate adenylyltransferase [Firmicutes bacterium]|nr:glucose-1-phosphate adenylyltransferase [Bacillota bacterium]
MARKKKCIAMLLAGGQGSRLAPLTENVAKPAVPFGGRYRIIDFSLSNCVNSNIDTVGVLTQYQPLELNDYLGTGDPWDLDLNYGGLHVLPPYQAAKGGDWFKGTANAIYQNQKFISNYDPDYILVLSGDHIYKMNYEIMLKEHIDNDADATIAVMDVPIEEASRFGIMSTDEKGLITEFAEKPAQPKSTLASMGVYIFNTDKLLNYLEQDEQNPDSDNDFGKNVIPAMLAGGERLYAYLYKGYWRDVGTLSSYWSANMDTLGEDPELWLNDDGWRIYYRHDFHSPTYLGEHASLQNCNCAAGNEIDGHIFDSVIGSNIVIEEGAVVRDCVIMNNVTIGKGAHVEYAIIDHDVEIGAGAKVGGSKEDTELTVIATGQKIPPAQTGKEV